MVVNPAELETGPYPAFNNGAGQPSAMSPQYLVGQQQTIAAKPVQNGSSFDFSIIGNFFNYFILFFFLLFQLPASRDANNSMYQD